MKTRNTRPISPNVVWLGIISFLNDMSSEMILPILPLFIESMGGGKLSLGIVGGIRDSVSSILNIFSGYWAAATGRKKPFVFAGYLTSAVFKLLLAFSATLRHAVVFSSLERMGKGLRTAPRDAIIAESMPHQKGRGFGIHRALDTSGAIVGSVAVFIMLSFFGLGFKLILLISAIVAFASLTPLAFVKENRAEKHKVKITLSLKKLPSNLRSFIIVTAVFSLGNFSYMFFIARTTQFISGAAVPVLLYVLFNISYAALAVPLGILSDTIGKQKVIMFGYLLFAVVSFGFIFSTSVTGFVVLFILYGVVNAAVDANQRALVADLSGPQLKASALGIYHAYTGLMALPASLLAGALGKYDAAATFIYGAVVALACVFAMLALVRYSAKSD